MQRTIFRDTPRIVSFSGGKDSTAMLIKLVESGRKIDDILYFDSGWEFPEMAGHIDSVEKYIGMKITRLYPPTSFDYLMMEKVIRWKGGEHKGEIRRYGYGWPSFMRRWCTREKAGAIYRYSPHFAVHYIGMAFDEQHRIGKTSNNGKDGILRYPLIDWGITEADALSFCYSRGFTWGGLYKYFSRVSCYCCPLQRIGNLRILRREFPKLWKIMLQKDRRMKDSIGFRGYESISDLEKRFSSEGGEKS